jgi:hypothetical protein
MGFYLCLINWQHTITEGKGILIDKTFTNKEIDVAFNQKQKRNKIKQLK